MQQLLDNIKQHMHWVVFLLLEAVSLVLLFRLNPYQQSVWFSHASQASGMANEAIHQWVAYSRLGQENRRLTEQNIMLQHKLSQMRDLIHRVDADTSMLATFDQLERQEVNLIPARVVDNSVRQRDNLIVINRGAEDGVRTEMGVLCAQGVVGIVSQVGPRFSVVMPVLNQHSSISCRLRGTNYFGYLRWQGGDPLTAVVEDIPHHAQVKVGQLVETSGFSNVFPSGIFLGRITHINNSADGLSYALTVRLGADLARTEQVMVIDGHFQAEIQAVRDSAQVQQTKE